MSPFIFCQHFPGGEEHNITTNSRYFSPPAGAGGMGEAEMRPVFEPQRHPRRFMRDVSARSAIFDTKLGKAGSMGAAA